MIAWKIYDTKNNLDFDEVVLLKWSNINIDIISLSCKLIFCMHIFWKNISCKMSITFKEKQEKDKLTDLYRYTIG